MPTSKKRVKKNREEAIPVTKNPLKTTWGKVVIVLLALGFVGSVIASLAYNIYSYLN